MGKNGIKAATIRCVLAAMVAIAVRQPLRGQGICATAAAGSCNETSAELRLNDFLEITDTIPDIFFQDTTDLPGGNDWAFRVNDGPDPFFGIRDTTNNTTPFRLDAGAPNNSIRVAESGRLGLGTTTPGKPLHIANTSPALRFDDTNAPQLWDLLADGGGFDVRDETAKTSPFQIRLGAPTSSLRIASNGDIGLGTASPDASLDIERSTGNASINMTASTSWQIRSNHVNDQLNFVNNTDSKTPFRTGRAANTNLFQVGVVAGDRVDITGKLFINNAGPVNAPDYVFQPGYEIEPIEEHAAYMWEKSHLPAVGAGKNEVDVMQATWGILEELEKAHIYIERLNEQAKHQKAELTAALAEKDRRLAATEERLARLEALLSARPGAED